jgi:NAD(P)-dependent dehydrogenase (short-subunit alcohol dehydrogenase family)
VAQASLASSAIVTISSSSTARVSTAVSKLQAEFPSSQITGYACDLASSSAEENIKALFSQIKGPIDHIVFTAGELPTPTPLASLTLEALHSAGVVRYYGAVLVAKVGINYMSPGPGSSITLTTGSVADKPNMGWIAASGFTAALHGVTRALALELKPVRVNLVSPGQVVTDLWAGMEEDVRQEMYKAQAAKVPTGHVGLREFIELSYSLMRTDMSLAEEVAEAYLWLMKDTNVTGFVAASNSGVLLV